MFIRLLLFMVSYSLGEEQKEKLTDGDDGVRERVGDVGIVDENLWIASVIPILKVIFLVIVVLFLSILPYEIE